MHFITRFKITDVDENKGKLDGHSPEPVLFDLSPAAFESFFRFSFKRRNVNLYLVTCKKYVLKFICHQLVAQGRDIHTYIILMHYRDYALVKL